MVINPWINRDLYTHCKHQWNWFQGKKQEIPHILWENLGFPVKMFPNLSNHWILGFLWTPFESPHRGHNSLAFLWFGASSQSTHVAVAGVNPKVTPNSPWFSQWFTMFFFWKWLFSETIFGDCLDKTMRLTNCIIYHYLPTFGLFVGKMMVICVFFVGFFHQQLTRTHLVRRTSWIKNSLGWSVGFFYDLAHRTRCFLVFPAISCDQGRKFLQCPDPPKKQIVSNCGPATIIYVFFLVIFCFFNTISFDAVG